MDNVLYTREGLVALTQTWAPRILAAVLILVVAWIVGRVLKSVLARAVDKIPALAHHNQGSDRTAGQSLGDVAYWLVLLIGVVAALNALRLGQVAGPLNTMLNNMLGYIPNIIGAGLIFFVGFIVATLARKLVTAALQAVNLDRWMAKAGLRPAPVEGAPPSQTRSNLASAFGTLVFVLILIPVAIAALNALNITAISAPAVAVLSTVLAAIPNVLGAGIVLVIGFVIARWISQLVERVLPATGFDRALGSVAELSTYKKTNGSASPAAMGSSGRTTPSKVVAMIVFAAILAFTATEAARMLKFEAIAVILTTILALGGKIVLGAAIIAVGVLIADVLANLVSRSTGQADQFAAKLVRWAAIALSVAMGLKFMGLADEIVLLAFGLILGSAAVAAALAFGLGGRDAAGRLADGWVSQIQSALQPPPGPARDPRMLHADRPAPEEPRSVSPSDGDGRPSPPLA